MGFIFDFSPLKEEANPMVVTSVVTYTFPIGPFLGAPSSRYGPSVDWGVHCWNIYCYDMWRSRKGRPSGRTRIIFYQDPDFLFIYLLMNDAGNIKSLWGWGGHRVPAWDCSSLSRLPTSPCSSPASRGCRGASSFASADLLPINTFCSLNKAFFNTKVLPVIRPENISISQLSRSKLSWSRSQRFISTV